MSQVYFILQGKGGIGKSFIASLIAQYLQEHGGEVRCFDTDPINATLSSFPALNAKPIELLVNNAISQGKFDNLIEDILADDTPCVIDNGAASFLPLSNYLVENLALELLQEQKRQPILHSVVAGGLAQDNTLSDLNTLAQQLPDTIPIIVWLNEFQGPIERQGKAFEEMKVYQQIKNRISGIIRLPQRSHDTYGNDIATMVKARLTFTEAIERPETRVMSKQRLTTVRREVFQQLAMVI